MLSFMKKTPYLEVQYHIQENFENHTDEIELLFSHGMPFTKGNARDQIKQTHLALSLI